MISLKGDYLINHTVKHAQRTKSIHSVFVSTNDNKIKKILPKTVGIINRPEDISKDTSTTEECIFHFILFLKKKKIKLTDVIVLLQCTSPYREKNDIDLAIKNFKKKN